MRLKFSKPIQYSDFNFKRLFSVFFLLQMKNIFVCINLPVELNFVMTCQIVKV